MELITRQAYDLQEDRVTVITETEYGFEILGSDGAMYPIEREYAYRYLLEYLDGKR